MFSSKSVQMSASSSVVVVVGIFLLLIFGKELFIPLAFSLVLALLLLPLVSWLQKRKIVRHLAVLIAGTLAFAILIGSSYVLLRQTVNVAKTLPGYRANIQNRINSLNSPATGSLRAAVTMIEDLTGSLGDVSPQKQVVPVQLVVPRGDQLMAAERTLANVLRPLGELGIVLIFTIYMLMNWDELRHRMLLLAGIGNINPMTRALDDATHRISRYLVMQFQVNACYGLLFGSGLALLHVPNAILWGAISGVLRSIPFAGTLIGMLLPLTLSIAISSNWLLPLAVLSLFLVLEALTVNFVEPWLFSSRTGISSLALLASAIFWSMMWGWPGLVLSTPLTVCVVVLGRHMPQLSFLHSLLGTNARLSPTAHLYERLLAMDQNEAWSIVETYLGTRTLLSLYDTVVIPALGLAEIDMQKGVLDDAHFKFILLWAEETVARLAEHQDRTQDDPRSERSRLIAALKVPTHQEIAMICLSAGDKAAELVTTMLAQMLDRDGHNTLILRGEALSDEILGALGKEENTVLFISALPPFAFAQTRTLIQKIRSHMPNNRVAVTLWNSQEEGDDLVERFGTKRPNVILKTLAQTLQQTRVWQQATPHISR